MSEKDLLIRVWVSFLGVQNIGYSRVYHINKYLIIIILVQDYNQCFQYDKKNNSNIVILKI